ncbi:MAG: hypothetical protein KGJ60_00140 [Verrucomicrobiota bacterium]|nr:hypothetical protein [Verrucomicrobiota bacterium]
MQRKDQLFTVMCASHPSVDICDNWETVVIVLRNSFDAKDAANEASLYLIWERGGQAYPMLVIEGNPKLTFPDDGVFDAEDYDDTITFARGKIVSCRILG